MTFLSLAEVLTTDFVCIDTPAEVFLAPTFTMQESRLHRYNCSDNKINVSTHLQMKARCDGNSRSSNVFKSCRHFIRYHSCCGKIQCKARLRKLVQFRRSCAYFDITSCTAARVPVKNIKGFWARLHVQHRSKRHRCVATDSVAFFWSLCQ